MSGAARRGRIVVVGDVMTDVIVRPEGPMVPGSDRRAEIVSRPGGSGANQAMWLAALGAEVAFAGRVGAEDRERIAARFAAAGVVPHLAGDPARPTGTLVTLLDAAGERSFLTDRGANLALAPADLPPTLLEGAGLLLVSGYSLFADGPRGAVRALAARAMARNVPVAVDAASAGFIAEAGPVSFIGWTAGAAFLFANSDEAALLAESEDPDEQMALLGTRYGTVVIKRGADGALLGGGGGAPLHAPAPRVVVRDTSGAGDAFASGFLAAWQAGASDAACLQAAVATAARAVAVLGGQPPPD